MFKIKKKKKFIIPEIPKGYKAHPFSIDGYYTMPDNLEGILKNQGLNSKEFEGSFIVPPQAYLKRWFSKRYVPWQALLFKDEEIIHVKDSLVEGQAGKVNTVKADDLLYLKLKLCLLYGKLDIACTNGKDPDKVVVEYNTVGHKLLEPYLERFLVASWQDSLSDEAEDDVYKRLKEVPVKYRNGVSIYVLSKGEKLLDFIYIPRLVRRFGFIKINLIPDILFAVTDRQLVILEDDLSPTSSYTWLLTYIPRKNFSDITLKEQKDFTLLTIKINKSNSSQEFSWRLQDRYIEDIKRLFKNFG